MAQSNRSTAGEIQENFEYPAGTPAQSDRSTAADIQQFEDSADAGTPAADAKLGDYFNRVENLVWIKGKDYYKEALADCKERKKLLGDRLDRREKRSEELTNQIYNVVGFFSVFQGVILTAVTQLTQTTASNRPLCGKVWFPVVLSLLSSVVASVGVGLKFSQLHSIDLLIHDEKLQQREADKRETLLLSKGQKFKFRDIRDAISRPPSSYWIVKALGVIGAVVVFTVILILSYFVILCDRFVIKD